MFQLDIQRWFNRNQGQLAYKSRYKSRGWKEYIVTYHYALTNTAREYLGIFYGTEPTAEAMTTEALAMYFYFGKGFLEESAGMILECKIKPETTGTYYIGFYDNADKYSSAITAVYDFGYGSRLWPDAFCSDRFHLIPDQTGKLEVELSAKAPAIDANGDPIASLLSMEFIRGKEVIHTIETPVPGSIYIHILTRILLTETTRTVSEPSTKAVHPTLFRR